MPRIQKDQPASAFLDPKWNNGHIVNLRWGGILHTVYF